MHCTARLHPHGLPSIEQRYHLIVGLTTLRSRGMNTLAGCMRFALLIIAGLGVAHVLPVSTIGCCAIGLAGAEMVTQLCGGNFGNRKFQLITTGLFLTTMIILGIIGVGGGFSTASQLGYGLIGVSSIAFALFCCGVRGCAAREVISANENYMN